MYMLSKKQLRLNSNLKVYAQNELIYMCMLMFSTSAPSKQLLQCKNRVCARQNLKSNLEYVNILSYINLKKKPIFCE